jgi:hypothetical protein
MKTVLAAAIAAGLISLTASVATAAGQCPANAAKASTDIWPAGFLKMDQLETGMHPCGKQMSCHGGNPRRGIGRRCQWL